MFIKNNFRTTFLRENKMKNLLIISALLAAFFGDVNTMPPEQNSRGNNQHASSSKHRAIKSVSVKKYILKKPTLSLMLVPDWHQIIFQNKIFWWEFNLRGSSYSGIKLYAPLHIRSDTPPDQIFSSLCATFHPQEIKCLDRFITILE